MAERKTVRLDVGLRAETHMKLDALGDELGLSIQTMVQRAVDAYIISRAGESEPQVHYSRESLSV